MVKSQYIHLKIRKAQTICVETHCSRRGSTQTKHSTGYSSCPAHCVGYSPILTFSLGTFSNRWNHWSHSADKHTSSWAEDNFPFPAALRALPWIFQMTFIGAANFTNSFYFDGLEKNNYARLPSEKPEINTLDLAITCF